MLRLLSDINKQVCNVQSVFYPDQALGEIDLAGGDEAPFSAKICVSAAIFGKLGKVKTRWRLIVYEYRFRVSTHRVARSDQQKVET